MFKKHANCRSNQSKLRNDQSPKIIDGHKNCAIYLANQNICNEENGVNGNLKIRKLKDQKSKVRNQWETQKTGKQKGRNKKNRKQRDK
ncbi:hypothetical protein AB6D04_20195 [Vibrio splendidus]|uniref:hypothetical protein n=1 Tax=Vibrio splendidus TaxID=29497 RepID=UPI001F52FD9E|nr:hypothetical protein [Vibrio splendidus]